MKKLVNNLIITLIVIIFIILTLFITWFFLPKHDFVSEKSTHPQQTQFIS